MGDEAKSLRGEVEKEGWWGAMFRRAASKKGAV